MKKGAKREKENNEGLNLYLIWKKLILITNFDDTQSNEGGGGA